MNKHDDALQRAVQDYPHPLQGAWVVKKQEPSNSTGLTKIYLVFVYCGLPTGTSAIYNLNPHDGTIVHNANEASEKLIYLPQVDQSEMEQVKRKANQLTGWLAALWTLSKERLTAALGVMPEQDFRTECILAMQEDLLHPEKIAALFPELSPSPTPTQADLQWEWDGQEWSLRARLNTGDEWKDLGLNLLTSRIDRRYENYNT
jgi:hypothetical protein